jgi:hypothetical protein
MTPEITIRAWRFSRSGSPLEGERACEELRSHGIKCDCTEMPPPAPATDVIFGATRASHLERLYVVVAVEDADRATSILQAWEP